MPFEAPYPDIDPKLYSLSGNGDCRMLEPTKLFLFDAVLLFAESQYELLLFFTSF